MSRLRTGRPASSGTVQVTGPPPPSGRTMRSVPFDHTTVLPSAETAKSRGQSQSPYVASTPSSPGVIGPVRAAGDPGTAIENSERLTDSDVSPTTIPPLLSERRL